MSFIKPSITKVSLFYLGTMLIVDLVIVIINQVNKDDAIFLAIGHLIMLFLFVLYANFGEKLKQRLIEHSNFDPITTITYDYYGINWLVVIAVIFICEYILTLNGASDSESNIYKEGIVYGFMFFVIRSTINFFRYFFKKR